MSDIRLLTSSRSSLNLKRPQALTPYLCDQIFMNALRQNNNKVHQENKIIQVKKCFPNKRIQVSHVFTGESVLPPRSHVAHVYVPSQVMFNDSYFEFNPKIRKENLLRYKVEKEIKSRPKLYSDEFYLAGDRKYAIQQKIKDNYSRNPLSIHIETDDQSKLTRNANRTENLVRCNSSIQIKKIMRHLRYDSAPTEPLSKITNDGYQNGRAINHGYKAKKHFRVSSVGGNVFMFY